MVEWHDVYHEILDSLYQQNHEISTSFFLKPLKFPLDFSNEFTHSDWMLTRERSCHTRGWVTSHVCMGHATYTDESCPTHKFCNETIVIRWLQWDDCNDSIESNCDCCMRDSFEWQWRRRSGVLIFALNRQCMRVRVNVSLVRLAPRTWQCTVKCHRWWSCWANHCIARLYNWFHQALTWCVCVCMCVCVCACKYVTNWCVCVHVCVLCAYVCACVYMRMICVCLSAWIQKTHTYTHNIYNVERYQGWCSCAHIHVHIHMDI